MQVFIRILSWVVHICGDLDFEDGGNPVVRNCIMAAADPVLVDAHAADLLYYRPEEIPYIKMAERTWRWLRRSFQASDPSDR